MHIKICGLTTLDDALAAVDAGADSLGFNFYPPSPRYVTPAACAEMVREVRRRGHAPRMVGVFVNAQPAQAARLLRACELDLAQLVYKHEAWPPGLDALSGQIVLAVRDPAAADLAAAAALGPGAPAFLIDANSAHAYGGTGQTADWQQARAAAERYPILLAGGLAPGNVAAAIEQVQPWGVDVASGVEWAPGRKDPRLMQQFARAARSA